MANAEITLNNLRKAIDVFPFPLKVLAGIAILFSLILLGISDPRGLAIFLIAAAVGFLFGRIDRMVSWYKRRKSSD